MQQFIQQIKGDNWYLTVRRVVNSFANISNYLNSKNFSKHNLIEKAHFLGYINYELIKAMH